MKLEGILFEGFALAHRRLGLIFVDMIWKAVWLAGTAAALLVVGAWFGGQLGAVSWEGTAVPAINGLLVTALLREFWAAHRAEMLLAVFAVLFVSAVAWFVLEAFFRRWIVGSLAATEEAGPSREFNVFILSGVLKATLLAVMGALLSSAFASGAAILAVVIFLAVAFLLTTIETLIRNDAVDLFGTDLIRVAGLLGILLLFESMIDAAIVAMLVAGLLNVARLMDALVMLGAGVAVIVFLNVLHSYLLLVRFSAVGIMRRNVVEV